MELELRSFEVDEFRAERKEGEGPKIKGYAAVFNKRSQPMFGMVETIRPGAFTNALKRSDVRALWNHNPDWVLGRQKPGTLRLEEDDKGLRIENDPPDTQWARDLMVSIDRGDVAEMSFSFRVKTDEWTEEGKFLVRTIIELEELRDVSPVTFPAYRQTKVEARSLEAVVEEGRRRLVGASAVATTPTEVLRRRLAI